MFWHDFKKKVAQEIKKGHHIQKNMNENDDNLENKIKSLKNKIFFNKLQTTVFIQTKWSSNVFKFFLFE